jgi:hypothetical protein
LWLKPPKSSVFTAKNCFQSGAKSSVGEKIEGQNGAKSRFCAQKWFKNLVSKAKKRAKSMLLSLNFR